MADASGNGGRAAIEFRMPSLGADMAAGTVVQWRVKPGDLVKRGDIVAEVETEKGVFEVDLPFGGAVEELLVAGGTKVPVGTVLARLRAEGAAAPAPASAAVAVPAQVAPVAPAATMTPAASVMSEAASLAGEIVSVPPARPTRRASPAARRLAGERGIPLEAIEGTGPDHVIRLEDVQRAIGAPAAVIAPQASPSPAVAAPMRQAIAAAVSRSKREIPHYYLGVDIDLDASMRWLAAQNAQRPVTERLIAAPLLLKAVAIALGEFPDLNGSWVDGGFRPAASVHIGVAVSLRAGGLVAPALHDVGTRSLDDLMAALRDLVQRARGGGLRTSEMMDATITVTNLGDEGATSVYGVIYPPQVALVGFGRIAERAWAVDGMLGVRPIVTATLAADHRATDGHYGSRFLAAVDRVLQHPETL